MEQTVGAQRWEIDHDYVKTMGLQLLEGRDFSAEIASDSQAFIVNRSMARALNLKNAIGTVITNGYFKLPIIGVIEDFHSESLKENIEPLCLQIGRSSSTIAAKINTADMPSLISDVSRVWKKFSVNQPIRYTFLDQTYARMYDDVQRMGNIFSSFAVLAIVVASLGLFGLSTFMIEQRNKEISIRLILGASLNNILRLVTLNYIKLVLIAIVLATPLSIFFMQEWLKEFAYRIDITWQFFAAAGIISLSIALITISYQSIRAALTNPVNSLREQ